ncbi:hypothetical protein Q5P01_023802 [Channa striata]|uniref:Uncharacterized protein n=1 Tax=Channa striata TaxID=64152 RepID=A0AA88J6T3_CHASR|nr:hypothetical protein Q5P01_023802 [Channa striata]
MLDGIKSTGEIKKHDPYSPPRGLQQQANVNRLYIKMLLTEYRQNHYEKKKELVQFLGNRRGL